MQILLVEDDERFVSFLKRGLEEERYKVDVSDDGEEAVDMAAGFPYDLIILDLMLPSKNGIEVCKTLRARKIQTPILILTARDATQDKIDGLKIGADDYLTKPFAFGELLARIEALLRRGPYRETVTELNVADLTLNRETYEVRRGTTLIHLTPKEFSLLEYLISHPNRVFSRTSILERIWGYQYDTLTNVVDVYIRHLRKKIDDGQSKKLIHTVQGVGYKISSSSS